MHENAVNQLALGHLRRTPQREDLDLVAPLGQGLSIPDDPVVALIERVRHHANAPCCDHPRIQRMFRGGGTVVFEGKTKYIDASSFQLRPVLRYVVRWRAYTSYVCISLMRTDEVRPRTY